ncbi:MAG TPA: sigma-70 family RNA polymerase sigma factor [Polyangiaceae bacterium]|nr:sigma-70 family RNA polymerase sigma factor [Polyangiaceae bacterium]
MTFEDLYEQNFEFVWRTLRRLGVPAADLPDVAQEVFLVVHRRLADFEERGKVTAWLFRISARAARDRRRRAHVRREVAADGPLAEAPDPGPDPSVSLERAGDRALLEQALSALDQDQREVFTAFELEGLSGQAIATALEIPLGTVYSRLRLGRERFRQGVARVLAAHSRTRFRLEGA